MKTVFLRALEADDKATTLRVVIREPEAALGKQRFEVAISSFADVPRSPFAYWLSDKLRRLFVDLEPFESHGRTAKVGLQTSDDFRFLRCWWSIVPSSPSVRWFPLVKGGRYAPYYADITLVVNWNDVGSEIKAFAELTPGTNHWSRNLRNTDFYGRPGISWPYRPHQNGSFAIVGTGALFSVNGPMAFLPDNNWFAWLGLLNTRTFHFLVQLQMARGISGSGQTLTYEVGMISRTPVPQFGSPKHTISLAALSRRAWSLMRFLDTSSETSHAFTLPALLQLPKNDLATSAAVWAECVRGTHAELGDIQNEINACGLDFYGVEGTDRRLVTEGFGIASIAESTESVTDEAEDVDEAEDPYAITDDIGLITELAAWAVGVAFGRFDVRLATGTRTLPPEPGPFDPLPACSPGMLTGEDGLPLAVPPADYPIDFPLCGMLVDDEGHPHDVIAAVRSVFEVVFGDRADAFWQEAAALLETKGHNLRNWLMSAFFEFHLKRYSKSRRKAPIYWQFGTPSGRYSVWLYAHRLTRDSLYQLQNDVIGPKLAHEERKLLSLVQAGGASPTATQRKATAEQETFVGELRAILDEVKRVAPLWNPDLDDGVVLTLAPLWRLVPQHKPWQRELKARWDEMCAGNYDWSQIAMHLWPERVVAKCAADRSLAIAHRLEDVLWVEDLGGHWRPLGSRAAERKHVSEHWSASPRCALLVQARDLWQQRYRNGRVDDGAWWQEVAAGDHDDHPLSLSLWPHRVCASALDEPRIAKAHGLKMPNNKAARPAEIDTIRQEWIERMVKRHGAEAADAGFVREAFQSFVPPAGWLAWWQQLDQGALDQLPLARYLRPNEVAAKCQGNLQLAATHAVERFFFVDRGAGPSPRMEPAAEIATAISERSSPAVKAALNSLMNAGAAGATARPGSRGSRATATGGNRS